MKRIINHQNSIDEFNKFIAQFNLETEEINKILKFFRNMARNSGIPGFAWPLPDKFEIIKHLDEIKNSKEMEFKTYDDRFDRHLFDYIYNLSLNNELGELEIEYIDKYRNSNAMLKDNFEWFIRTNGIENNIENFHVIYKGKEEFENEENNKYIFIIGYSSIPFLVHEFSNASFNMNYETDLLTYLYYNSIEDENILNRDKKYAFSQFLNLVFDSNEPPTNTYPNFINWIKETGIKFQ